METEELKENYILELKLRMEELESDRDRLSLNLQFLEGIIKELLMNYDHSEVNEECHHDISERVRLLKELWGHGLLG
jgi:6-pyruvoyl-tetrahydropterin synthase